MSEHLSNTDLKRLHRDWRKRTKKRLALIIDGVQGPYNVGSIIRSSAAERVDFVWFCSGSTTPDNLKTRKTALGTERYIKWTECADVTQAIKSAKSEGYKVAGLELTDDAVPIHELNLNEDICFLIGHEDRGVSKRALELCDVVTFIPQLGKVGSLNVSVAVSIALYEMRRQGWS
ncbi:MAG: rRNA methyltransferase [Acidimicrobiaceae bacterium]|nr:rRNA methyltransferase [Acidimicrobiaceae bacterium]|tara:strand:- start:916 stop:1440 length:525 start_codon:yes stop_codon:yes gene_type:complete